MALTFSNLPVGTLNNPNLLWSLGCGVLPLGSMLLQEPVKLARHVLTPLVIPQLLDPFAGEELSLSLELLVGKEGITLLVKEVDAMVSREVVNEEGPVELTCT